MGSDRHGHLAWHLADAGKLVWASLETVCIFIGVGATVMAD